MVIPSTVLNDSSLDELCDIPRCSIAKAKLIDKNRPFDAFVCIECFDCRQGLIDQFNKQESIFVFLLSTRAGELMVTCTH